LNRLRRPRRTLADLRGSNPVLPRGTTKEPRLGGLPAQLAPRHDEIPKWPAYTLEQCATMFLDAECQVVSDPYRDERLLWKEIA
jgi:hypothetical protein